MLMNLSQLTLDREGLAAAIACDDAAFEEALREEAYRVKVGDYTRACETIIAEL